MFIRNHHVDIRFTPGSAAPFFVNKEELSQAGAGLAKENPAGDPSDKASGFSDCIFVIFCPLINNHNTYDYIYMYIHIYIYTYLSPCYPLVMTNIANWKMAIERCVILIFPMKDDDFS